MADTAIDAGQVADPLWKKISRHVGTGSGHRDGHDLFPREEWRSERACGDTRQDYPEWLVDRIEMEIDEAIDAVRRFLYRAALAATGDISEIQFCRDILVAFSDLRILNDEAVDAALDFLELESRQVPPGERFGAAPPDLSLDLSRLAAVTISSLRGDRPGNDVLHAVLSVARRYGVQGKGFSLALNALREQDGFRDV